MYKRRLISLLIVLAIILSIPTAIVSAQASSIDTSLLNEGVITVTYKSDSKAETKVVIKKDKVSYTYDLNSNGIYSLTMGNGNYEVSVLENISQNRYKVIERKNISLNMKDSKEVFTQSVQVINWNNDMEAIKKAASLTKNLKSDSEKASAIYNFIVKNYSYDYSKVNKLGPDYVPDIDKVYKNSKGICYDFAVLYAAMLRSAGIPAKLVMGYKNDIETYHAWNQVYLKDSGKWITVDTTYDSIMKGSKKKTSMVKSDSDYKIDKVF